MFEIGISIGIFSYIIFFLGLAGLLYKPVVIIVGGIFWLGLIVYQRRALSHFLVKFHLSQYSFLFKIGMLFFVLQMLINALGLFGPEIGFDALWYHLTLPKLYLLYHAIVHIPGAILFYSDMPKLTEMLYVAGISLGSDFFARGIHFLFGILDCIILYKIGRKFFSPSWAVLIPIIFYSSLVVGWESVSAYIDLSRTFFASLAFFAFLLWTDAKEKKFLIFSAVFTGFAITTKLLAMPDIAMYAIALWYVGRHSSLKIRMKNIATYAAIALVCPLPWFVFAFVHTGNPLYPIFSIKLIQMQYWQVFNPIFFANAVWTTFARASDPISPFYLAMLPLLVLYAKKLWRYMPLVALFSIAGLTIWYVTPQTGGGRYILPYLPALTVLCVYVLTLFSKKWQAIFLGFLGITLLVSLFYRGIANAKVVPLLVHRQTKSNYLQQHLDFALGDFYDTDGYFKIHIKSSDKVLLYGFHNLYYVDFPFIDSTWVKKGDWFDFVAVQGKGLPARFHYWSLMYYNPTTHVRLYSLKGQMWEY